MVANILPTDPDPSAIPDSDGGVQIQNMVMLHIKVNRNNYAATW